MTDKKGNPPPGVDNSSLKIAGWMDPFAASSAMLDLWAKSVDTYFDTMSGRKTLAAASYDSGKDLTEFLLATVPGMASLIKTKSVQELMRSAEMAEAMEKKGNEIEATRKAMGLKPSTLFTKYNHQFLTEDDKGKVVSVSQDEILRIMRGGDEVTPDPERMPRIIFTSSHARGEDLHDITGITHGIKRMVHDATDKKVTFGYCGSNGKFGKDIAKKTIIIYRCDVRENSWLNGASLLRRVLQLEAVKKDKIVDSYSEASPGARAIERMMLAAMSVDPQRILKAENKPLREVFAHGEPIQLRSDAARVAQHFMQMGYSKGGNVVSDSLRMLVDDLTAKTKGGPLFQTLQDGEWRAIDSFEVRSLMRQITTWAMASLEHELSPEMIKAGARRVAFNSTDDTISSHQYYDGNRDDERWFIQGVKRDLGHNPEDALGTHTKSGYAMEDPRIRRRMVELCAPMIGKATIAGVKFDANEPSQMIIETGAGTSDRIFNDRKTNVLEGLKKAGFAVSEMTNIPHSGEFIVHFKEPLAKDLKTLQGLQDVFIGLRNQKNSGLVIADEVMKTQIPTQAGTHLSEQLTRRAEKALGINQVG